MHSRKLIMWILIGLGIITIVGYSAFALKGVIQGPNIEIATPQNGSATTTPLVIVAGRVLRGSTITLNGATSTLDLAGNFKETLLLAPGYNIMSLEAMDRYRRTDKETIEMTLITKQSGSQNSANDAVSGD